MESYGRLFVDRRDGTLWHVQNVDEDYSHTLLGRMGEQKVVCEENFDDFFTKGCGVRNGFVCGRTMNHTGACMAPSKTSDEMNLKEFKETKTVVETVPRYVAKTYTAKSLAGGTWSNVISDPVPLTADALIATAKRIADSIGLPVISAPVSPSVAKRAEGLLKDYRTDSDIAGEFPDVEYGPPVCRLGGKCILHSTEPKPKPYVPAIDDWDLLPDA